MRLYVVRVRITEGRAPYPAVVHEFYGETREKAWGHHEAHRRTDSFLRRCEDHGRFSGFACRASVSEGWVDL